MVLFDEDPTALLRETTNQFHIPPDKDSLARISSSLGALSTARQSRLDQHHGILKSLSRRLNSLEEGRRWEEDRHDAGGHAERMLKMDTEKFRIAKGVSDAEIESERLEGELAGLRTQMDVLEKQGVEGPWRRDSDGEDEVVYVFARPPIHVMFGI
jgi:kinetochore protein Spc24